MNKLTLRTGGAILLIVWGVLSAVFYGKNITSYPEGVHAWAMSDYYAMSLKFAGNGLRIFQPQTFSLSTKDGITASDLPLPAWLSGLAMLVSGSENPGIFRFLTLCFGFTGFFFLYRGLYEQGIPAVRAVVLTLLAWLLPGLAFYHDGFLPSVWALSAFLIGLWAIQRDLRGESRYWTVAVGAFLLAALLRKPYILHLAGLLLWQVIFRKNTRKTVIGVAGIAVFSLWQLYDLYLYKAYGSIFLRHFMLPKTAADTWKLATEAFSKWGMIWFSPAHLAWMAAAILLLIPGLWKNRKSQIAWHFWGTAGIGIGYFVLMLRQFSDHDYYVIDSFYPVLFVGLFWGAKQVGARNWILWLEILLLVLAIFWAKRTLNWYYHVTPNEVAEKTGKVYRTSRPLLDSLGISQDAKMMVFEAFSTNIPLIGMGRSGYCLLGSSAAAQEKVLGLHPDYAICLDTSFISEVVQDNPGIVQRLELVGRNADLWVFRPGNFPDNNLEKLLSPAPATIIDTSGIFEGEYLLSKVCPVQPGSKVVFYGMASLPEGGELKATVSLFQSGVSVKVLDRTISFPAGDTPVFRATDINVPAIPADEVRIYLWNPNKRRTVFTNFNIAVLPLKPSMTR